MVLVLASYTSQLSCGWPPLWVESTGKQAAGTWSLQGQGMETVAHAVLTVLTGACTV
jgi:hypothetical protein